MFVLMAEACCEPPGKLKSVRELLCVSGLELQKVTGLSQSDIQQLLTAAAISCRQHPPVPGCTSNNAVLLNFTVTSLRVLMCVLCLQPSCSIVESVPGWSPASGSVLAVRY